MEWLNTIKEIGAVGVVAIVALYLMYKLILRYTVLSNKQAESFYELQNKQMDVIRTQAIAAEGLQEVINLQKSEILDRIAKSEASIKEHITNTVKRKQSSKLKIEED